MDRKKFIQTSGFGLGVALIPGMIQGQSINAKKITQSIPNPKLLKILKVMF